METELMNNKRSVMLSEVLQGLSQNPKTLPCKYFYDEKGSEIYKQIIELEEYYLVRTEQEIMKNNIQEIIRTLSDDCFIIEFGCGSSSRICLLLDHMSPAAYIPIDISKNALMQFVKSLKDKYPKLKIVPVCTDYTQEFNIPNLNIDYSKKIIYYPGSNIGNFKKLETFKILKIIHNLCRPNGGLLIGIDLKKDKATLEKAYNDTKGITAQFNLNILNHINNELGSNFNIDNFRHKAIYNEKKGQIEMHLFSKIDHEVKIGNQTILFEKNESILTEISCKYDINEFKELVKDFFEVQNVWTDKDNKFGVLFLKAK
ncbi:MAG: L-histidine N(alpha)-methyltransferase [Nanoarchaeota archaeon]|nr:L-histidine N(alpha)-methyltransferase [Nanoarchaeota archaeon]